MIINVDEFASQPGVRESIALLGELFLYLCFAYFFVLVGLYASLKFTYFAARWNAGFAMGVNCAALGCPCAAGQCVAAAVSGLPLQLAAVFYMALIPLIGQLRWGGFCVAFGLAACLSFVCICRCYFYYDENGERYVEEFEQAV
jgi:hypothetical protein